MSNAVFLAITALVAAYLMGSFPMAYVIGRLGKGIDIRQVGTRNMGAMNVFYQVGFWAGILVLVVDIGKGAAAITLARGLGVPLSVELLAGVIAVLGHGFPVFLRFRGGRGGATCIGILAFLMPWGIPLYLAVFGIIMLLTRFPTLSYSAAFLIYPVTAWLIYHRWEYAVFSIGLPLIPLIKYIPRIAEMHTKAGSWRNVLLRRGLKDRY